MNKKTLILAGVAILIAAVFLVLPRIIAPKSTTPTAEQPSLNDNNTVPEPDLSFPLDETTASALSIQAKAEFDFAFSKAKEWRQDATPMGVTIKYAESIAPENGTNTYIFFSPSLAQYYFTMNIEQKKNDVGENNFERIIYYKEDYFLPNDVATLPIQYWINDYLVALEKADDLAGKEIRSKNPQYDVNMFLFAREDQFLNWTVEYLVDGAKKASVPISAFTGEVVTE